MLKIKLFLFVSFVFILDVNSLVNVTELNSLSINQEPSKWYEGELYLKDGTVKKGLIKYISTGGALGGLQSFNKIFFKKNKKSKKQKFKKELVSYFTVNKEDNNTTKYTYIKIKKNKTVLARVEIEGKASLYTKVINGISQSNGISPAPIRTLDYFCYVQKEGDEIASGMFMPNILKSFKKEASEYFITCKALSNKIENGELDIDDKVQIVNEYNDCF